MASTYLIVRGVLDDTWRFTPYPGFELPAPPPVPWPRDDAFRLICLDADDRPLLHVVPFVHRRGCGSVGDPERHLVLGVLPLPPGTAAYRLLRRDVRLHSAEVAPDPPRVPVPTMTVDGDDARLDWAPDADMSYAVLAETVSGDRARLAEGLTEAPHGFSLHELPPAGVVRIMLEASDGVRSAAAPAGELRRDPLPPAVHILQPQPGVEVLFGQPVSLLGTWLDESGDRHSHEALRWYLDGAPVGEGAVAVLPEVAAGRHRLTLLGADQTEISQELVVAEPTDAYRAWREITGVQPGYA